MERAVFGASEFFSQEAFISVFRGIDHVRVGRLKGSNIEVVEVWFNPWKVSYNELIELFFDLHDPTMGGSQDCKNQSFVFFTTIHQLRVAKQKKLGLKDEINKDIITEIIPVCGGLNVGELKLIS
ncbi:peptide-methionine (S)-S-oxide reductase [Halalkalibacter okhensis]|uniref:peptide-methionine (S)-S-oxide reductase n=1 Tax=Halalkalibacter okhensis TaxID=333138 RepID=UPI00068E74B6|nr:peptide-methionine (S)-S-oxide reductase [Halalkalibacter okhensis]